MPELPHEELGWPTMVKTRVMVKTCVLVCGMRVACGMRSGVWNAVWVDGGARRAPPPPGTGAGPGTGDGQRSQVACAGAAVPLLSCGACPVGPCESTVHMNCYNPSSDIQRCANSRNTSEGTCMHV